MAEQKSNAGIIALIVIILIAVFGFIFYETNDTETVGENISQSVEEAGEEIGDEIDDNM